MPRKPETDCIFRNRSDAMYRVGEEATFHIHIAEEPDETHICLSNDGYKVFIQHPLQLKDGKAVIKGTLDQPGFLRCRVNYIRDGKRFSMLSAATFDPYAIQPTTTEPEDFDDFWQAQKVALADIPPDPQLSPDPEVAPHDAYHFWKI